MEHGFDSSPQEETSYTNKSRREGDEWADWEGNSSTQNEVGEEASRVTSVNRISGPTDVSTSLLESWELI